MQANKSLRATYYGPFDLDDLRQIVKDTAEWPGDARVRPEVTKGDRPWESDSSYITITSEGEY